MATEEGPAVEAAVTEMQTPSHEPAGWSVSASPKTVIVIDGETDYLEVLVMILQSAGHNAHGSTEGGNGLRLVLEHDADVVVLDYLMPDINGAQVGKALRAHEGPGARPALAQ